MTENGHVAADPVVQVCQSILTVIVAHYSNNTMQMVLRSAGPLEQQPQAVAQVLRGIADQLDPSVPKLRVARNLPK
jgi:hypothetical protein